MGSEPNLGQPSKACTDQIFVYSSNKRLQVPIRLLTHHSQVRHRTRSRRLQLNRQTDLRTGSNRSMFPMRSNRILPFSEYGM